MPNTQLQEIRSRAHGVWQKGSGLNQRARFIINPGGIIMGVAVLTDPVVRNVAADGGVTFFEEH